MSDEQIPVDDIIPLCKQILQELLSGKTPEEVQADLAMQGVSADDAENLINVSVASAQAASPILEEGGDPAQAVEALTQQGMDDTLATPMVQMLVSLIDGNSEQAPADTPAAAEEAVDEEHLKSVIRLGIAVDSDLSQGVEKENIVAAISNISDIGQYPEIAANVAEFIENVRLARNACNKSLENNDLQKTMSEMGLHRRPAYVAMLTVFFNKAAAGV